MVGWVLGDQLAGRPSSTRLSNQLGSRRQVVGLVGYEAGGKARDPSGRCSEMVEQGGGGRYRWLRVKRQSMKRVAGFGWIARQSMQRQPMAGMGIK